MPFRLHISYENQPELLAYAADKLALAKGEWPDNSVAIGVFEAGVAEPRAVIVFVRTYRSVVDMHIATDGNRRWASRAILGDLAAYVFEAIEAPRLQCITAVSNEKCRKLITQLGLKEVGVIPGGMEDGEDAVLYSMLAHECTWLKGD